MKNIWKQMLAVLCAAMLLFFSVGSPAQAEETPPETPPQEILTDEAEAGSREQEQEQAPVEEPAQDGETEEEAAPEEALEPAQEEEPAGDAGPEIDTARAAFFSPAFQSGYAMLLDETAVYREEMPSDRLLAILGAGMTVYVRGRMNAGADFDQLSIVFQTSLGLQFGFISAKNARPFSHEESFAFSASLVNDGEAGEYNGRLIKKLNCQIISAADEAEQPETIPEDSVLDSPEGNPAEASDEEEQRETPEGGPVSADTEDQAAETRQEAEAPSALEQGQEPDTVQREPAAVSREASKAAETDQQSKAQAAIASPSAESSPAVREDAAVYPATLSRKASEILAEQLNQSGENTPGPFVPGDADQDQQITKADGIALLNAILELEPITEQMRLQCDVDGNGTIDIFDAIYVMSAAAGLDEIETGDHLFTAKACGEGQVEVTGYNGTETDLAIPSAIGQSAVVRIADGAFRGGSYTSVRIPAGVTAIGTYAFSDCGGLQWITVPESVETIGQDAMAGCAEDLLISTSPGSAAHAYALENGIDYQAATAYRVLLIAQTYEDIPRLRLSGTTNDAADIAACLSFFRETPYQIRTKVNLSKSEILNEISSFFGSAEPWDVSMFYFAGHGVYSLDDESHGALQCADGKEYITGKQLRAALDQIPGRKIVITDSCYSGHLISSLSTDSASGISLRAAPSLPGAGDFAASFTSAFFPKSRSAVSESSYYVLTAASENERSYEDLIHGQVRGLFSSRFVSGCGYNIASKTWKSPAADANGNGSITLDELYTYISGLLSGEGQHIQVYPAGCRWFGILRF